MCGYGELGEERQADDVGDGSDQLGAASATAAAAGNPCAGAEPYATAADAAGHAADRRLLP